MITEKQEAIKAPASQEDKLNKHIGTIESKKLEAKPIIVLSVIIKEVPNKKEPGKIIGEMAHLLCKHPDAEDPIDISKTKYLKDDKINDSGLWYNEDADGNIVKASALAAVLSHYGCANLKAFEKQELQTISNSEGYLCIKAF